MASTAAEADYSTSPGNTLTLLSTDVVAERPRVLSCAQTDRGHVRERNEDQYLVAELRRDLNVVHSSVADGQEIHSDLGALLAVADGVGSIRGGEVASAMAIDAFADFALGRLADDGEVAGDESAFATGMEEALERCQARMGAVARRKGLDPRMATTLTAAYLRWPFLSLVQVGDSRAYVYRRGRLLQVTHDQTVAQELIDRGALEAAAAADTPMAHTLTSSIGGNHDVLDVQHRLVRLQMGDLVLLCTDGLHGEVQEAQIAHRLAEVGAHGSLGACAQGLIDDALATGGHDNITLVLAHCRP